MKRYLCVLLMLAWALSSAPALAAEAPSFSDVPEDYWAWESIERAAREGVVQGTGGGLFSPERPLSAAEFTAMLLRGLRLKASTTAEEPEGQWYGPYTAAADALGLYEGTSTAERSGGEGDYDRVLRAGMDWDIPRYDMAVMLYRAAGAEEAGLPFTEADFQTARDWAGEEGAAAVGDWEDIPERYRESAAFCFCHGLLAGVDSRGTFDGGGTVTRAQAAAILCRLLDLEEEPGPEEAGSLEHVLANGQPMTEANVRAVIEGFRSEYPEGMEWTNDNFYQCHALRINGYGCVAFALICSDAAFGDLPVSRKHSDFDAIRVGDTLRVNGNTHTVIVLEKKEDSVIIAEGNYNGAIHWDRELDREKLEGDRSFYVETRYPETALPEEIKKK